MVRAAILLGLILATSASADPAPRVRPPAFMLFAPCPVEQWSYPPLHLIDHT